MDLKNKKRMKEKRDAVILLHATSHALRAEKLIRKAGISCRLIPVPRHLSSDCGVCVRLEQSNRKKAINILEEANIEYEGVHDL